MLHEPAAAEDVGPDECSILDWKTVVENMGMMNGVERVVCWSGTLGKTLGTPNLLNQEDETFNNLYIALSGLFEQVRGLPVRSSWSRTPPTSCTTPPPACAWRGSSPAGRSRSSWTPPTSSPSRSSRSATPTWRSSSSRSPRPSAWSTSRMSTATTTGTGSSCAPGRGALDYGRYLRAIAQHVPEVPIILENVRGVEEMRAAREFIEATLKEYGL